MDFYIRFFDPWVVLKRFVDMAQNLTKPQRMSYGSQNLAQTGLELTTYRLRVRIPLPLTFKEKRHSESAFFIAGAGLEPATFGL